MVARLHHDCGREGVIEALLKNPDLLSTLAAESKARSEGDQA